MLQPESMSPGSIMPPYNWLITNDLDTSFTIKKIAIMRNLGVPYSANYEQKSLQDLIDQAKIIAKNLRDAGIETTANKEIIALTAYLQRLGIDIKGEQKATF
jgi:cytochrome c oxidase cbb3-type subunit I/II